MPEDAPETGDRRAPVGSAPILVDTSNDPEMPEAQGDRRVEGEVFLVRDERRPEPTADEYRAAGYTVPDHEHGPVEGDQVPGLVYADKRAPEGTVILVDKGGVPEPIADEETDAAAEPETAEGARADAGAEEQGLAAARTGEPRTSNPHDRRTTEGKAWDKGWSSGQPDD